MSPSLLSSAVMAVVGETGNGTSLLEIGGGPTLMWNWKGCLYLELYRRDLN